MVKSIYKEEEGQRRQGKLTTMQRRGPHEASGRGWVVHGTVR
jgi:hypothetical protein